MKSLSTFAFATIFTLASLSSLAQSKHNQLLYNLGLSTDMDRIGLGLTAEYRHSPNANRHAFGIQNDIRLLSAVYTDDLAETDEGVYCTWLATYTYTLGNPTGRFSVDLTGGAGLGFQRVNNSIFTWQISGQITANIQLTNDVFLCISPLIIVPNKWSFYTTIQNMAISVPLGVKVYF